MAAPEGNEAGCRAGEEVGAELGVQLEGGGVREGVKEVCVESVARERVRSDWGR
jgi:hypothetical protein